MIKCAWCNEWIEAEKDEKGKDKHFDFGVHTCKKCGKKTRFFDSRDKCTEKVE